MPPAPALPLAALPSRRRHLPLAALGLAAALVIFGWGIVHLFELRFAGGDVYPAYSTFRKDPLGAAAFHDALAALPGLSVERNLRPLAALALSSKFSLGPLAPGPAAAASRPGDAPGPLVCFYLGADAYEWPRLFRHNEFERLDAIMRQGGRVVLTFLPGQTPLTEKRLEKFRREQSDDEDPPPDSPARPKGTPTPKPVPSSPHPAKDLKRQLPAGMRWEDLIERWDIDFRRVEKAPAQMNPPPAGTIVAARRAPAAADHEGPGSAQPVAGGPLDGAGEVSWHSALDFDLDTPEAKAAGWRALYRRGSRPVIIARRVGGKGGQLILASDSYFLSNEALRAEARPELLAELVGPSRRVIFDETHLGIAEQPGMMTLARRYHLQGGLAALGLLAVLFIWRNVVSLVPPPTPSADPSASTATVTGRDAAAGFLNLLQRGVLPRELIAVCLAQWQHAPGQRKPAAATAERLRALAAEEEARPASRRSPAAAYRAICAALRASFRG